jgi:SAM-dependent methyltransferase
VSTAVYDEIGRGYAARRKPDPRIGAAVFAALGDARSVINVGAGAGSYEPDDREVLAVEPSEMMIRQRPRSAARCVQGSAEALPVDGASFDAAMAVLTIHHWSDWRRGLREMRRVARRRVVLLTFDGVSSKFWLTDDYFPEIVELDRQRMPLLREVVEILGATQVIPVPVPHDCTDGFLGAYWRRPESYLDPDVRGAMSCFSRFDAGRGLAMLADDLKVGRWHQRYAHLLALQSCDLGYRLVTAELPAASSAT